MELAGQLFSDSKPQSLFPFRKRLPEVLWSEGGRQVLDAGGSVGFEEMGLPVLAGHQLLHQGNPLHLLLLPNDPPCNLSPWQDLPPWMAKHFSEDFLLAVARPLWSKRLSPFREGNLSWKEDFETRRCIVLWGKSWKQPLLFLSSFPRSVGVDHGCWEQDGVFEFSVPATKIVTVQPPKTILVAGTENSMNSMNTQKGNIWGKLWDTNKQTQARQFCWTLPGSLERRGCFFSPCFAQFKFNYEIFSNMQQISKYSPDCQPNIHLEAGRWKEDALQTPPSRLWDRAPVPWHKVMSVNSSWKQENKQN